MSVNNEVHENSEQKQRCSESALNNIVMCDGSTITADELNGYDEHDVAWMLKTKRYPPTALQLCIAFGKFATGTKPGDEMWCNYDQDALDYSCLNF